MGKKLIGPAVVLFLVAGAGYWAVSSGAIDLGDYSFGGTPEDFVATVNGEGIEQGAFDLRFQQAKSNYEAQGTPLDPALEGQLKQQILDNLIVERLLVQYGREQGIEAEVEAVEEQYQQAVSRFENEEAFQKQLALQNNTPQDVRDALAAGIVVQRVAEAEAAGQGVEVSEAEVHQAYDQAAASAGEDVPAFEEVKEQVEDYVRQQKVDQLILQLIDRLRAGATIEILGNVAQ